MSFWGENPYWGRSGWDVFHAAATPQLVTGSLALSDERMADSPLRKNPSHSFQISRVFHLGETLRLSLGEQPKCFLGEEKDKK